MTLHVAYIPPFAYPSDTSSSLRVTGIATALIAADMAVSIASTQVSRQAIPPHQPGRAIQLVDRPLPAAVGTLRRVLTSGSDITTWLDSLEPVPDLVLLYGTDYRFVRRVSRWARRQGIPLVFDVVEWYDNAHLPLGRFGPHALANTWTMWRSTTKAEGCVTISSYLADHYRRHGTATTIVPPLFEVVPEMLGTDQFSLSDGAFHIGYVGIPGKKDAATLDNLLTLVHERSESAPAIHVHLAGPPAEQLRSRLHSELARSRVTLHGRLDRIRALQLVTRCDATALQRPLERYAQAGFPSKVAESLMCGTPVVANLTTDLDDYLTDGVNGVILRDASPEALHEGIDRAVRLATTFDRSAIRASSQETFAPGRFAPTLGALLRSCVRTTT